MTIRYVLNPSPNISPNYNSVTGALADAVSGDEIHIHNSQIDALLVIRFYIDNSQVVLAFNENQNLGFDQILNNSSANFLKSTNNIYYNAGSVMVGPESVFYTTSVAAFNEAYKLKVHGGAKFQAGTISIGTATETGTNFSEHLRIDTYGNLRIGLTEQTLLTINSSTGNLMVTGTSVLNNNVTATAALNVSGTTTLLGNTTAVGRFNVSGESILLGNATLVSQLNVSGMTTLLGATTSVATFNVSGESTLLGNTTAVARFNVSGETTLLGNTTAVARFNVSGETTLLGCTTLVSQLNVSGETTLLGNTTAVARLNVSGESTLLGNTTMVSQLNVSGKSTFQGDMTALSQMNLLGDFTYSGNMIKNGFTMMSWFDNSIASQPGTTTIIPASSQNYYGCYIDVNFGSSKVYSYIMQSNYGSNIIKWTIAGSNDRTNWYLLDSQETNSGINYTTNGQFRDTQFTYVRFIVRKIDFHYNVMCQRFCLYNENGSKINISLFDASSWAASRGIGYYQGNWNNPVNSDGANNMYLGSQDYDRYNNGWDGSYTGSQYTSIVPSGTLIITPAVQGQARMYNLAEIGIGISAPTNMLSVSGTTFLNGSVSMTTTLNVSGETTLLGNMTAVGRLNVSGESILLGNTTMMARMNVSGESILLGNTTAVARFNVSGESTFLGNTTIVSQLNVSGMTTLLGNSTAVARFNVSGETTLLGNTTLVSQLNVSGESTLLGNTTLLSQLNVSGKSILEGAVTTSSTVNINGTMTVLKKVQNYIFSVGNGGTAGTNYYAGGGGAGGIIVKYNNNIINPSSVATKGADSNTSTGGNSGIGFGAGGGGGSATVITSTFNGEYVQFDVGTANIIRTYTTFSDNSPSYPLYNWALLGSNDPNGVYNIVDNHDSGQLWGENNTTVTFTTNQTTAYRYYRLIFLRFGGGYLLPTLFSIKDTNGSTINVSSISLSSSFPSGGSSAFYINTDYNQHNFFLNCPTYGSGGNTYTGSTSTPYSSGNTSITSLAGGNGANGFVYIRNGDIEYFTQASTSYTFSVPGPTRIIMMGGGGSGGNNASTNNMSSGGGGAGYLQTYDMVVLSGQTANITIGNGGIAPISIGGFRFNIYSGYFNDNTNWFASQTPTSTGIVTDMTSIGAATNGIVPNNGSWDSYSVEWYGQFRAPATGTYTFYTASDDASYLWIGANASSGYTTSNCVVNNGGPHGVQEVGGTISLVAGTYYPLRIQFGEEGGGDNCIVSFDGPGISRTYNFSNYVTTGSVTDGEQSSVVINGVAYNANGGINGAISQTGGAGSSMGGSGTTNGTGATNGMSGGMNGQGATIFNNITNKTFNSTILFASTEGVTASSLFVIGASTASSTLNVSGESTLLGNTTAMARLNVSGESTLLGNTTLVSQLNVSGMTTLLGNTTAVARFNVSGESTLLGNTTIVSQLNVSGMSTLLGNTTAVARFNVSGESTLLGNTTLVSQLNVSGESTLLGNTTAVARFNVSGESTLLGNATMMARFNVSGESTLLGNTTLVSQLNVSGMTTLLGNMTAVASFNVSGESTLLGNTTMVSQLNVSGESTLLGNTTLVSRMNVSGETTLLGNATLMSQLNVSGKTTLLGNTTLVSQLNVSGESVLLGDTTLMSQLNVSGKTTLLGNATLVSQLNVSGESTLLGNTTAVARFNVSGMTTLLGDVTSVARFNVSGESTLLGDVTSVARFNVSGESTLLGCTTAVARFNVSGESTLLGNTTLVSQLNVSGMTTLLGSTTVVATLNVSGESTFLGNTTAVARFNVSGETTLLGNMTAMARFNVSGESTLLGNTTMVSQLNVSGMTTLLGNMTAVAQLNVSGESTLLGNTTLVSQLNVSGMSTLLGNTTAVARFNVSGESTLLGNTTLVSQLNVSGESTLLGNTTMVSQLNVSGMTTLLGNTTIVSQLNVSGETTLLGNATAVGRLNVSGQTTLLGDVTAVANLYISGNTFMTGTLNMGGQMILGSNLSVSGASSTTGPVTQSSSLNVSGMTTLQGNVTMLSQLNLVGDFTYSGNMIKNGFTMMSWFDNTVAYQPGTTIITPNSSQNYYGCYIDVNFSSSKIRSYVMQSNSGSDIIKWTIAGSNDRNSWYLLDSQETNSGINYTTTGPFIDTPFTYVRFIVRKINFHYNLMCQRFCLYNENGSKINISLFDTSSWAASRGIVYYTGNWSNPVNSDGANNMYLGSQDYDRYNNGWDGSYTGSQYTSIVPYATITTTPAIPAQARMYNLAEIGIGISAPTNMLSVSGTTFLNGSVSMTTTLNVSGETTLLGNMTAVGRLNVSGESTLLGNATMMARMNVSGESTLLGNTTLVSQLNVSGETTLLGNTTAVARFNVSGESSLLGNTTLVSQLNVSGMTTLLGNTTVVARFNVSGMSTLLGDTTLVSQLNVSGESTLLGNTTAVARLNVSGESTLLGNTTMVSQLNVSGMTILQGDSTVMARLNVSGESTLLGYTTIVSQLNVSGMTTLLGATTAVATLNVSGESTLLGNSTMVSRFNVSGESTLLGNTTLVSRFNVSGESTLLGNTTLVSQLNVSGKTTLLGNMTAVARFNVSGESTLLGFTTAVSRFNVSGESTLLGNTTVVSQLNVSGESTLLGNTTLVSQLNVSGNTVMLGPVSANSTLNVSGESVLLGNTTLVSQLNVSGMTTLLGNTTVVARFNVSGESTLLGNTTAMARFNVSGITTLLGNTTLVSQLNVSGKTTLLGATTAVATLNVSGESTLLGNTTLVSRFNVSGESTLLGNATAVARFNVSGESTLLGNATAVARFNVSGETTLLGCTTLVSQLNVSGQSTFLGNTTAVARFNVSGESSLLGNTTLLSQLNVSGKSTFQGDMTALSQMNLLGDFTYSGNMIKNGFTMMSWFDNSIASQPSTTIITANSTQNYYGCYIDVRFSSSKVYSYVMQSNSGSNIIKWTIAGSNDRTNWYILDSQETNSGINYNTNGQFRDVQFTYVRFIVRKIDFHYNVMCQRFCLYDQNGNKINISLYDASSWAASRGIAYYTGNWSNPVNSDTSNNMYLGSQDYDTYNNGWDGSYTGGQYSAIVLSGTISITAPIPLQARMYNLAEIGIGISAPTNMLSVSGTTFLNGAVTLTTTLNVSGESTLLGNMTAVGRLNVSGESTLLGNSTMMARINVSGESTLLGNATMMARMNVSGETTLLGNTTMVSQLNVSGMTTLLGYTTAVARFNVSGESTLLGNTTLMSQLNVSGMTTLQGVSTLLSTLNVSGESTLLGNMTAMSQLNVSGKTTLLGFTTAVSRFNVSGESTLLGNTTVVSQLNVSGMTTLLGNTTMVARFNVSGESTLLGNTTMISQLNVSGMTTLVGNTTVVARFNVSGESSLLGNTTMVSQLNVSGMTTLLGNVTLVSQLNVSGQTLLLGNMTAMSQLNVSGKTTLLGSVTAVNTLNVSGESTLLGNTTAVARLNVSGESTLLGNTTMMARMNVSGESTLLGNATMMACMNVSGESTLLGNVTLVSQLNVSGMTTLLGFTTVVSRLNVSGESTLLGNTTIVSQLNVSGMTTLLGFTTAVSRFNVSGESTLLGNMTALSQVNVSGMTTLQGATSILSSLNVSGQSTLLGNTTLVSQLNVSGMTTLLGSVTAMNTLNVSGMTTLQGSTTVMNTLNVSGLSTMQGATTMLATLNVSGNTTLLGPLTATSTISVSGKSTLQGDVTGLASLNISGISMLNGATTLGSTLSVMGDTRLNTIRPYADTITGPSVVNETITIVGHYINIGNSNSVINIQGTTTSVFTNQIVVEDPLIVINSNAAPVYNILGNDSGIEISAISSVGYLKTNPDATKFALKAPQSSYVGYIVTKDNNDNLVVTGTTTIQNATTMISTLNVSGMTTLLGNTTIVSQLNISGMTTHQGATTLLSTLNVSGQSSLVGNTTLMSQLNVSGMTSLLGNTTAVARFNVSGESTLLGCTTLVSQLNVSGMTTLLGNTTAVARFNVSGESTLLGNVTAVAQLNVSGTTTHQGATTMLSTLNVSGQSSLLGNVTLVSQLNVSGMTNLQGATTINSTLSVSGQTTLLGNTTLVSQLNVSGMTTLLGNTTAVARFNVSGESTLLGNVTAVAQLNISGMTTHQGATTLLSTLNVSGQSSLLGNVTLMSQLNVSGMTNMQGSTTLNSTLNVSGQTTLQGATTVLSILSVSGVTIIGNAPVDMSSALTVNNNIKLLEYGTVTTNTTSFTSITNNNYVSQADVLIATIPMPTGFVSGSSINLVMTGNRGPGYGYIEGGSYINNGANTVRLVQCTYGGAGTSGAATINSTGTTTITSSMFPLNVYKYAAYPGWSVTNMTLSVTITYGTSTTSTTSSFQQIATQGTYNIFDNLNSSNRICIDQYGDFGINNSVPIYTLDVGSYYDTVFNIAKLNATDRSYMSYSVSPSDIYNQVSYARTFGGVATASQNGYFAIDLLNSGTFASSLDITTSQMYMTTSQTWFKTKIGAGNMTNSGANKVLVSDASGYLVPSGITTTTLGYLDASSSIQTQFNALSNTVTNLSSFKNPTTALSSFNVSGNTTLQGAITGQSTLNVVGNTSLQGTTYIGGTLSTGNSIYSYSNAGVGNLKLVSYSGNAGDQWWLGFCHGNNATDSNDRARIGVDIKYTGAGRLFFTTGSPQVERMRLDENGYLGIGTSSPAAALQVHGSGGMGMPLKLVNNSSSPAEVALSFYRNSDLTTPTAGDAWVFGLQSWSVGDRNVGIGCAGTGNIMTWKSNGYVGIGTTNPLSLLDVRGTISTGVLNVVKSGAIANGGYVAIIPADDTSHTGFVEFKLANTNRQGYIGWATTSQLELMTENGSALTLGTNGVYRMYINTNGNVGIGTTNPITTRKVSIQGSGGTTNMIAHYNSNNAVPYVAAGYDETNDGYALMTNQGATDLNSTAMFIKRTTNNIGMGTTAPSYPLDLTNSGSFLARFKNTGSDYARIILDGASGTGADLIYKANGVSQYGIAVIGGSMQFLLNDSTTTIPMTISSGGLVGIGTSGPSTMLHVSGTTTLGGAVTLTSTLNISGITTLNNNMTVTAAATYMSTLNVSGLATLNDLKLAYTTIVPGVNSTTYSTLSYSNNVTQGGVIIGYIALPSNFGSCTSIVITMSGNKTYSSGYMEGGLQIYDASGAMVIYNAIGAGAVNSSTFNITRTFNPTLTTSSFPLSVQEYAAYPGWYINGLNSSYTVNYVTAGTSSSGSFEEVANSGNFYLIDNVNNSSRMMVNSSGMIGLGTTNPSTLLYVSGNSTLSGQATITSTLSVSGNSTLLGSTTLVSSLNVSGTSIMMGNVGIGGGVSYPTLTRFQVTGVNNGSNIPQQVIIADSSNPNQELLIGTSTNGYSSLQGILQGSAANNLSLNPIGGNVGINTTAPSTILTVYAIGAGFRQTDGSVSLDIFTGSDGIITAGQIGTSSNNPLTFYTNNSNSQMILDTTGFVGINTITPATNLHVSGNTLITGNMTVNSTMTIVGATTHLSTLNMSGTSYFNNNITINQLASSTITPSLLFSKLSDDSSGNGMGFYYNTNSLGNRQFCMVDSSYSAKNTTNNLLRFSNYTGISGFYMDSVSTDGSMIRPFNIGANPLILQHPTIHPGYKVGISTAAPAATLHVSGTTILEGAITTNSSLTLKGAVTALSTVNISGQTVISGMVGIGTNPVSAALHINNNVIRMGTIYEQLNTYFPEQIQWGNIGIGYSNITAGINGIGGPFGCGGILNLTTRLGNTANYNGIYLNNGNVGIGISSPSTMLHVTGTSLFQGNATITSTLNVSGLTTFVGSTTIRGYGSTSFPGLTISSDQTSRSTSLFSVTSANSGVSGSNVGDAILCVGDTSAPIGNIHIQRTSGYNAVLTATVGGSVGINNVTPSANFHNIGSTILQGAASITSTLNVSGSSYLNGNVTINSTLTVVSVDSTTATTTILNFKNNSGYGIYADSHSVSNRGNTVDFKITDYNSASVTTRTLLTMRPEGNVGIGTLNPAQLLHVDGGNIGINSKNEVTGQASLFFYNNPYMGTNNAAKAGIITEATNNFTRAKLHLCTSTVQDLTTSTSTADARLTVGADGYVGINNTNPTSYLSVTGGNGNNDTSVGPYTAEFKGSGAFDGCTVVRLNDNASQYGRVQLQMLGRYEAGNDGWSLASGRNNILFQSQISASSTITTNFALQNYGITRFGILSSYNANVPALAITGSNNYVGIGTDAPSALLHVSGTSILTGASTHSSTLNVIGNTILMNNLNVGTSSIKGTIQAYNQAGGRQPHLTLTGAEYLDPTNFTSTDGLAIMAGVNRSNNRQLWIADTSLAFNNTNTQLRLNPSTGYIDAVSTDGSTAKVLTLGNSTGIISTGPITANSSINVIGSLNLASSSINMTGIPNTTSNNNYVLTYNNSTGAIGYNGFYVTQLFNSQSSSWSGGVTSGNVTLGANSKMIQGTVTYYTTAVVLTQVSLIFTPVGGGTAYTFNFNKFFNNTYTHTEHSFTLALTNTQLPAGTYTCQAIKSGANSGNMATDTNDQIMIAITNYPN